MPARGWVEWRFSATSKPYFPVITGGPQPAENLLFCFSDSSGSPLRSAGKSNYQANFAGMAGAGLPTFRSWEACVLTIDPLTLVNCVIYLFVRPGEIGNRLALLIKS
jgi:hypothetical protein